MNIISSISSYNSPETATNFMDQINSAVHNGCKNEAIAHHTTVSGGMAGIHQYTDTNAAVSEYAQCMFGPEDKADISTQAQEKPQATMPSIGEPITPQGFKAIGTTIGGELEGQKSMSVEGGSAAFGGPNKANEEWCKATKEQFGEEAVQQCIARKGR